MPSPRQPSQRPLLWLTAIGFEFSGMVIGGVVLGWWLDGRLGTAPWLMVCGLILGASGAFLRMLQMLRAKDRSSPEDPS